MSTSRCLFSELSTRVFEHADQIGRDTILRALGDSIVDVELEKLSCPDREEDANEIYQVMVLRSFDEQKAQAHIGRAQDALSSASNLSPSPMSEGNPTPEQGEIRTAKWIFDHTIGTRQEPQASLFRQ